MSTRDENEQKRAAQIAVYTVGTMPLLRHSLHQSASSRPARRSHPVLDAVVAQRQNLAAACERAGRAATMKGPVR